MRGFSGPPFRLHPPAAVFDWTRGPVRCCNFQGRAEQLISECPLLTGQHITADALPRQLGAMARTALEHPTRAPAISEVGLYKLEEQHRGD